MKRHILTLMALLVVLTTHAQTPEPTPMDTVDVNSEFPSAIGAVYLRPDSSQYIYDVALSKMSEAEYDNAIHFVFHSVFAHGIAGSYVLEEDSSFVDGYGPIVGNLEITYLGESTDNKNQYHLTAVYVLGGEETFSKIDKDVLLAGISDLDEMTTFILEDDRNPPSGISKVADEQPLHQVQKQMHHGILYIQRAQTRYTLQGSLVK